MRISTNVKEYIMRQLQNNEVKAVSGAGLLDVLFGVGRATGSVVKPVVGGVAQATTAVVQPVATGTARTLWWLLF
jgi:cell division GTPase FtsZ